MKRQRRKSGASSGWNRATGLEKYYCTPAELQPDRCSQQKLLTSGCPSQLLLLWLSEAGPRVEGTAA